jgi:PAS domain S-box-containing protein
MNTVETFQGKDLGAAQVPQADPKEETRVVLQELLDKIFLIAVVLGTIALAGSTLRIMRHGFHLSVINDIAMYVAVVVLLALRRKIRVEVTSVLLFSIVAISAIVNLAALGLAGISLLMLTWCTVSAGVFFGFRVFQAGILASLAAAAAVGIAVCTGHAGNIGDASRYLRYPETWFTQLAGFAVYTMAIAVAVHAIQKRLLRSIDKVNSQARQLLERERQYRVLAENMTDVMFVQDMDLNVTYASPSASALFGWSADELKTKTMQHFMTPRSVEKAFGAFRKIVPEAVKGPVKIPLMEYEYVRKNGTTFWGELRVSFVYNEKGDLVGSQGILRDISDRKRIEQEKELLEEQLRQSDKMQAIGQLAGGVAHDFNNQLTGISGFAQLMRREFRENRTITEYAGHILKAAESASDLTRKLLAYARKGAVESVPVNMHAMIGEAVAILERSIDKRVIIKQELAAESALVTGDPAMLQNAVLNIALNARDAMPQGGEILFVTSLVPHHMIPPGEGAQVALPGSYLKIAVSDTGTGMDESVRKRIFEPFFTTKGPDKGTGMGLAAVFGTITSHHGTINVDSSIGKGTTVILYLPFLEQVQFPSSNGPEPDAVTGSGHVFVVEDEDVIRRLLSMELTKLGYKVTLCGNGKEALERYRRDHAAFDCVLLDMVLPGASGREVFRSMRLVNRAARIILISGFDMNSEVKGLLDSGAAGFIQKPYTIRDLAEKISAALTSPLS